MKKNIVIGMITLAVVFGIMIFAGQALGENLENYVTSEVKGALTTEVKQTLANEGYLTSDGVMYERTDMYVEDDVRYEVKSYFNVDTMMFMNVLEMYDAYTGDYIDNCVVTNLIGAIEDPDATLAVHYVF